MLQSIPQKLAALLACTLGVVAAEIHFPYNPSYAFLSTDFSTAFLLSPSSDQSTFQLSSINISSQLSASDLSTTTISSTLPFSYGPQTALAATADSEANLYLLSGACADGAHGTSLWVYNLTASGAGQNGWTQKSFDASGIEDPTTNGGLNFLGSALTFSGGSTTNPGIYVFGGLCPNSTSSTAQNWQVSGSYSNTMLSIQPASDPNSNQYAVSNIVTGSPPIPEAGFSLLPLEAAYLNSTNSSIGSQQNFAFIGGQTATAFINMSQVALFSLPEQSWSFIPVDAPSSSTDQDLDRKSTSSIDPRSGHAATLSSDGRKIVITGGWVGDVDTPANPQLLTLEVGEGYGGADEWEWIIPDQKNTGPIGLYGHAALMLPGDVLMITGGYAMPDEGSSKLRKRTSPTPSTSTYFYNVSSNTWIPNYQNPNVESGSSRASSPGGSDSGEKLGLGLGLGFGLPVLMAAVLLFLFWWRRLRKHQQRKDPGASQDVTGSPPYHYHLPGSGGIDGRGGSASAGQAMQEREMENPYPWAPTPTTAAGLTIGRGSEAERTGLLYDVPSPTRGLRRSLHSRTTNYLYDDGRRSHASGNIHPINEEDEDSASNAERNAETGQDLLQLSDDIVSAAPVLDPFQNTRERHLLDSSRTPSPQSPAKEREQEFRGWMNGWAAAESQRQKQTGRSSPDKSDRTSSSLSDSARSAVSALSYQPSMNRSSSQRSANLLAANVVPSSSRVSPPESPQSPTTPNQYGRSQSLTLGRGHRHTNSASSGPSFSRLQAEGQALLGATPPHSESPSTRSQSRARSWVGSFRRALAGGHRNSIANPEANPPSPEPLIPQRSASAGSMLWRRRQGARDWGYDGQSPGPTASSAYGPDDEDWDVESAVERRVVQVMFTVPRERLRVVNAGPSGDGISIASVEQGRLIDTSEYDAKEEDEARGHEGGGS